MSVSPAPNDSAALSFRSRPAAARAGFVSVAVAVWNDLLRHLHVMFINNFGDCRMQRFFGLAPPPRLPPRRPLAILASAPARTYAVPLPVGAGPQ